MRQEIALAAHTAYQKGVEDGSKSAHWNAVQQEAAAPLSYAKSSVEVVSQAGAVLVEGSILPPSPLAARRRQISLDLSGLSVDAGSLEGADDGVEAGEQDQDGAEDDNAFLVRVPVETPLLLRVALKDEWGSPIQELERIRAVGAHSPVPADHHFGNAAE